MDPQPPIPPETTEMPNVSETVKEAPKKDSHPAAVISVGLFIIASLATVIFLYYQNQKLKSMLAAYQAQPSPTPEATPDPTANWEIYTLEKEEMNVERGFSFKYPSDWTKLDSYSLQSKDTLMTLRIALSGTGFQCAEKVLTENKNLSNEQVTIDYFEAGAVNEYCPESENRYIVIKLSVVNPEAAILFYYEDSNADTAKEIFNEILSTFEFTG